MLGMLQNHACSKSDTYWFLFFVKGGIVICIDFWKHCSCEFCELMHVLVFVKYRNADLNECCNFVRFRDLWNYINPIFVKSKET